MTDLGRLWLRPSTAEDDEFELAVYASTRIEELAPLPWTDGEKVAFVAMQHHAQQTSYRRAYPGGSFQLVLVGDEPVGRLYVNRSADEIRIVDIALLTEWRGKGIGTAVLTAVLQEADVAGLAVTIHVEQFNPAQALYRRLGFEPVSLRGVHWLMSRRPAAQLNTAS